MNTNSITRRQFVRLTTAGLAGGMFPFTPILSGAAAAQEWDPRKPFLVQGSRLRVQPVLMYSLPIPKEATSWKSWGGAQTKAAIGEESDRITGELKALAAKADFGLEFLPLVRVNSVEASPRIPAQQDVTLVYACSGSGAMLQACLGITKDALIFVRHKSGPVYYWYEALSTRYLKTGDWESAAAQQPASSNVHVDDVVVDDYGDLQWRLRALCAVKSLGSTRIVALGGTWGKYAPDAPQKAQERFGLKIVEVTYDDFAPQLQRARANSNLTRAAEKWTERYLSLPRTRLLTEKRFVVNAFVLYQVFKDLMAEHDAGAFTIKSCMGTVIPIAETTACLSLGLLNDEGRLAFCESDFVIIPAGILMRYVSGKPVFLHNSTFPHNRMVTCAHCTSPRRLDGRNYAPVKVVTHYESEYGAAPKVEVPIGQEVTFIDPDYSNPRWLGFTGHVKDNPALAACRSQQDVEITGNWKQLRNEARDSHWVMVYGNHLNELGYAARKLGLRWVNLSESAGA